MTNWQEIIKSPLPGDVANSKDLHTETVVCKDDLTGGKAVGIDVNGILNYAHITKNFIGFSSSDNIKYLISTLDNSLFSRSIHKKGVIWAHIKTGITVKAGQLLQIAADSTLELADSTGAIARAVSQSFVTTEGVNVCEITFNADANFSVTVGATKEGDVFIDEIPQAGSSGRSVRLPIDSRNK